jgi:RNA polymerase sigma-70 factor (ECF subfamily)
VQSRPGPDARTEAWPDLLDRARTDRASFGEVYDLYVGRVYAFCLARARDREEAQDLTARTFERALKTIGAYESHGMPMSSWLFRIAANLAIDRGRKKGRTTNVGDGLVPEEDHTAQLDLPPEQQVVHWERARYLRDLIRGLPDDQQRAVRMRYFEGKSIAEIAEALERSENASKQLLHRAMDSLRRRTRGEVLHDV